MTDEYMNSEMVSVPSISELSDTPIDDDRLPGEVFMTLFGQRSEAVLLRVIALYGDSLDGMKQYEIANYLDFSEASVSRALSKIEELGLIYRTVEGVFIEDREMLSTVREFIVLLDGDEPSQRVDSLEEIDPEHKTFDTSFQIPEHALNTE
jgi:MarR family.